MKLHKKHIIYFFVAIFIVFIVFYFLPVNKIFAASLEVVYPKLLTGSTVTYQSDLAQYLRYIFDLGMFIGFFAVFLSLIWAGVLYLISGAKPDAVSEAKDRVSGAISGLLILALLYLIITTINPQLSVFSLNPLEPIPPPPPTPPPAGVNFYKSTDCSDSANTNTTSIPDLGTDLKNKVNSVKIISDENSAYISILYDVTNYWGKCQYISPNAECNSLDSAFAASASVYQFDFSPGGDGVYIYKKPFFNKDGGWMKITNSQIENAGNSNIYVENLNELKFEDSSCSKDPNSCCVPKEEQDCIKYDDNRKCIKRSCPTLAGENISSIQIKGDYLVLLMYTGPSDAGKPWYTSCQAFPTVNDVNKTGPNQVKWESIRSMGNNPNRIMIIPVKQN